MRSSCEVSLLTFSSVILELLDPGGRRFERYCLFDSYMNLRSLRATIVGYHFEIGNSKFQADPWFRVELRPESMPDMSRVLNIAGDSH